MAVKTEFKSYRDELVSIIKDCGQELIDRAEEMVAKDARYIGDFNINISIPHPTVEPPMITWDTSTPCTAYTRRKYNYPMESDS